MSPLIREKWLIALESNFLKPNREFLRECDFKLTFAYTYSPWGILCAISDLGEFVEVTPFSYRNSIKSSYVLQPNRQKKLPNLEELKELALSNGDIEDQIRYPPKSILEAAEFIVPETAKSFVDNFLFTSDECKQTTLTNHIDTEQDWLLQDLMTCYNIPTNKINVILSELFKIARYGRKKET